MADLKFTKHLGNGFWKMTDGRVFCTKTQTVIEQNQLPFRMKWNVLDNADPLLMSEGEQFIITEYCEDFYYSKSGKTRYVKFTRFDYISDGWAKVFGKFKPFSYNFRVGGFYTFFMEYNPAYPFNYKIISINE